HLVQVTGRVQEFTPGGATAGSFSSTELSSVTSVTDLGVGPAITPVQIGGAGGLIPPTADLVAGSLFYESLENMLVTVKTPTAVGPTNNFGEIFTVVDNDNDPSNGIGGATGLTPRGNILLTPGQVAFGDNDTVGGDYNPERVQIDADTGIQTAAGNMSAFVKPEVDVGAKLSDVTGVVTYAFANYQVLATQPYSVTQPSTLVKETGTLAGNSNHLLIASYNAENIDLKGPFDAGEVQRAGQAQAVNKFVDSALLSKPAAKIVVAGDLNEFQFEEPLNVLKGTASISNYDVPGTDPFDATPTYTPGGSQVLTDLQDLLPANERYDYVF